MLSTHPVSLDSQSCCRRFHTLDLEKCSPVHRGCQESPDGVVPLNDAHGYCLPQDLSWKKNKKENEKAAFMGADHVVLKLFAAAPRAAAEGFGGAVGEEQPSKH